MKSRIVLLLVVALIAPFARGQDQTTQPAGTIPLSIKTFLDTRYPGWVPAEAAQDDLMCLKENWPFHPSMVRGDFNGDGQVDYAVQIVHQHKIIVIEFLTHGTAYTPHILVVAQVGKFSALLAVNKKGEELLTGERLGVDALSVAPCGGVGGHYIFSRGKFRYIQDTE